MTERRTRHSIKRRLLVVLLLVTLLAWGVTLIFSYRDTRHELDELLDAHLAQSASLLFVQIGHEADDYDTEHAPPLHRYSRNVAFQVWEKGRKLVLHSASAPNSPLSTTQEGFSNSRVDGKSWRVFSAWDDSRHYLIQVGERRKVRDELAETIAENLLRPMLFALPVLGLLIWFGVARSLRPLQSLSNQVAQRRADNLTPLEGSSVPVEVMPLVEGLNQLFARLRDSLDKERRFTADAAHELRTPLAAIMTQAQVARAAAADAERQRALDNVVLGCTRAAHLVEQLLTLARLEPEQLQSGESCDLRALAVDVISALAPVAIQKNIDAATGGRCRGARARRCHLARYPDAQSHRQRHTLQPIRKPGAGGHRKPRWPGSFFRCRSGPGHPGRGAATCLGALLSRARHRTNRQRPWPVHRQAHSRSASRARHPRRGRGRQGPVRGSVVCGRYLNVAYQHSNPVPRDTPSTDAMSAALD